MDIDSRHHLYDLVCGWHLLFLDFNGPRSQLAERENRIDSLASKTTKRIFEFFICDDRHYVAACVDLLLFFSFQIPVSNYWLAGVRLFE